MKVFVCEESYDYEGSSIKAVFNSEKKAIDWTEKQKKRENDELEKQFKELKLRKEKIGEVYWDTRWEKLPYGWKLHGTCWTYQEFEVN